MNNLTVLTTSLKPCYCFLAFPRSHRSNFTLLSTNSSAIQAYYEIAVFSGYFCGIAIFADVICGNAVFSNPQCPPRQAPGLCQNNTASTSPSNTRPQISALADKFLFGGDIYVRSCASKSTTKGELSTFLKAVLLVSGLAADHGRTTFITCSVPNLQEEFSSCGFIQSETGQHVNQTRPLPDQSKR